MKNNPAIKKVGIFLIIVGIVLTIISIVVLCYVYSPSRWSGPGQWYMPSLEDIRLEAQSKENAMVPGYFILGFGIVALITGIICTAMGRGVQTLNTFQGHKQFPAVPQFPQSNAQYHCPNCNNLVNYGTHFCGQCGTAIQWNTSVAKTGIDVRNG